MSDTEILLYFLTFMGAVIALVSIRKDANDAVHRNQDRFWGNYWKQQEREMYGRVHLRPSLSKYEYEEQARVRELIGRDSDSFNRSADWMPEPYDEHPKPKRTLVSGEYALTDDGEFFALDGADTDTESGEKPKRGDRLSGSYGEVIS